MCYINGKQQDKEEEMNQLIHILLTPTNTTQRSAHCTLVSGK